MAEISSTSTKKLSLPKSIPWKRLALIAGVFFVIAFLIWAIPAGLAIYYQNLGGSAIQQVIQEIDELQTVTTYCYPPSLTDEQVSILEAARKNLDRSLATKPNYAHTNLLLGRVNCLLGNLDEAVLAYQHFTELRPDNSLGHIELAFAYERQGDCWGHDYNNITTSPSWKFGEMSCDLNVQETIREEWSIANIRESDLQQYIDQFKDDNKSTKYLNWVDRILWFQSQDPKIWYEIGSSFEKSNQWQLAQKAYLQGTEDASSDAPGFSNLYYKIGHIYVDDFDPPNLDEAALAFKSGIHYDRFLTDWEKADSHYQLGLVLRQQKKEPELYVDELIQAVNVYPQHVFAHIVLGTTYYRIYSDLDKAEHEIQIAIEYAPRNKWAYYYLGNVYLAKGLTEDAILMYQKAIDLDPDFARAREDLNQLIEDRQ